MFLGPRWEWVLFVVWRGGARGTAAYVSSQGSNEGQQGGTWWDGKEGRVVTMLVAGRDCCFWGVCCGIIARPGLFFFPIEGCREDSSEVESVHKNQAHLFASIRPSVK